MIRSNVQRISWYVSHSKLNVSRLQKRSILMTVQHVQLSQTQWTSWSRVRIPLVTATGRKEQNPEKTEVPEMVCKCFPDRFSRKWQHHSNFKIHFRTTPKISRWSSEDFRLASTAGWPIAFGSHPSCSWRTWDWSRTTWRSAPTPCRAWWGSAWTIL